MARLTSCLKKSLSSFTAKGLAPPSQGSRRATEVLYYIHGWQRHKELVGLTYLQRQSDPSLRQKLGNKGYALEELLWQEQAFSQRALTAQEVVWSNDAVVQQVLEQFLATSHQYPGIPYRFVGHSLGHQLALRLTERLIAIFPEQPEFWPQRLSLLEPAYVGSPEIRQQCTELMQDFDRKCLAIDIYRSSFLTRNGLTGPSNQELIINLPFPSVDLNHRGLDWLQFKKNHSSVKDFYFQSIISPPHSVCPGATQHPGNSLLETFSNYGWHFEQQIGGRHHGTFKRYDKKRLPSKCPIRRMLINNTAPEPTPLIFSEKNCAHAGCSKKNNCHKR